jgi:SAM-dependent methyltransferase
VLARLRQLVGRRPPPRVAASPVTSVPEPDSIADLRPDLPPCPADRVEVLNGCPVCGGEKWSAASAFNKLILLSHPPDEASYRYDFSMCHDCGVVFARRRPAGPRYAWMIEHFEETLGRAEFGEGRQGNVALASSLTDDERADLRRRAARGVFVSNHTGISRKDYLPGLLADRLSNSQHVELLSSLLPLRAPRILEVRARTGSISAGLMERLGARACAMTLFESHQLMASEIYGIDAMHGIDYDHFSIPFEGQFDLIISNHGFTHAIRPREMLTMFHDRLVEGGWLYLFNEPDEGEFLEVGKSVFNTLNAFHMQAFDGASLERALAANGFAVSFMTMMGKTGSHLCLAQKRPSGEPWKPIAERMRARRLTAYRHAQDRASITVPEFARGRLGEPWDQLLARHVASGLAEVNRKGNVKLRR